jgi:hypothetical protein
MILLIQGIVMVSMTSVASGLKMKDTFSFLISNNKPCETQT